MVKLKMFKIQRSPQAHNNNNQFQDIKTDYLIQLSPDSISVSVCLSVCLSVSLSLYIYIYIIYIYNI